MTDSVTFKKNVSDDEYGEKNFTNYTIKCRFDFNTRLISSPETGPTIASKATVLVRGGDKSQYQILADIDGRPVRDIVGNFILVIGGDTVLEITHDDKIIYGGIEYSIVDIIVKKGFGSKNQYLELRIR